MKGKVASHEVNVNNTLAIGEQMLQKFRADLPDTFHRPIKKEVVTMEWLKKEIQVGTTNIYDMQKLYAGLLVISQSRDIHLSQLFKHELSPVLSTLFSEYGDMRKIAQGCQSGTRLILYQDTLNYHFHQKNCISTPTYTYAQVPLY